MEPRIKMIKSKYGSCGTRDECKEIKQLQHQGRKKTKEFDPVQHHRNLSPTSWTLEQKSAEKKVQKVHKIIKQKLGEKMYREKNKKKRAKQWKSWYVDHKEVVYAHGVKRKQLHRDEIKEYEKEYRATHPEQKKKNNRTYYLKHKEQIQKTTKEYREANLPKIKEYGRKHWQDHKDEINKARREAYQLLKHGAANN